MAYEKQYTTSRALLEAALAYAALGYPVLPLSGKEPMGQLVPHGKNDATTDLEAVHLWFAQGWNIGVVPPAQVLVLDIDEPEAQQSLLADYPDLEKAPHALTGSGGSHIWLHLPEGVSLSATVRKLPGVDLRGMGKAYLVAPPSVHPVTGQTYHWVNALVPPSELPPVPPDLLQGLLPPPKPAPEPSATSSYRSVSRPSETRLDGLLQWACDRVANAVKGTRHNTLLGLSRLVGGWLHHGLEETGAFDELVNAGLQAGLPRYEAEDTVRDGLRYGAESPLDLPNSSQAFSAEGFATNESASWTTRSSFDAKDADAKGWGSSKPAWPALKGGWE